MNAALRPDVFYGPVLGKPAKRIKKENVFIGRFRSRPDGYTISQIREKASVFAGLRDMQTDEFKCINSGNFAQKKPEHAVFEKQKRENAGTEQDSKRTT